MDLRDKHYPAFTDLDLMFFGKYNNLPIQDVPAHYLKWCWDEAGYRQDARHFHTEEEWKEYEKGKKPYHINRIKLANYLFNSMDAIKMELKESGRE